MSRPSLRRTLTFVAVAAVLPLSVACGSGGDGKAVSS